MQCPKPCGQRDDVLRGTLELNAPRTGGGDIAVDASGTLSIQGARSIGLNAVRSYSDAADGTDPAASGRPYQVIDQAYGSHSLRQQQLYRCGAG